MFDFPNSPAIGNTFTPPGGPTYKWDGQGWISLAATGGGSSGGTVTSVNAQTGDVFLDYADVGASPTIHTHVIADVTGLQTAIDGKSPVGHTHAAATSVALGMVFATPNPGGQVVTGIAANGALTFGAGSNYTLPTATAGTIGGVKSGTATADRFVTHFDATGNPVLAQVSAAGLLSGPSFAAYLTNSSITTANVAQKIIVNSVEENTGNCYNAATGRFTPTVPGWYFASLGLQENATTQYFYSAIYKNGAQEITGNCQVVTGSSSIMSSCGSVVKMNGTTDYLEAYAACGAVTTFNNLRPAVYFTATYMRAL